MSLDLPRGQWRSPFWRRWSANGNPEKRACIFWKMFIRVSLFDIFTCVPSYIWRTGYGRISWYFWYATLWPVTRLSCAWFLARVCSIGFCIREAYAVPLRRLCAALWTNNKVSTAIIAALQLLLIRKLGGVYSWWIHEWLIRFPSRKSHISNRCSSILGKF